MNLITQTYFELHGEELLKERTLSKAQFAEKMGIKPQNLRKLFETKNVTILSKAAAILEIPVQTLISGPSNDEATYSLSGFVEFNGVVNNIKSKQDLVSLLSLVSQFEECNA